jgi:transposase
MLVKEGLTMRKQRTFTAEFKREVVEELLSGTTRPAQICRRYSISSGLLYHWRKQYSGGRFGNEPIQEAAMQDRIERLERMVGRLTLENEFLKKALRNTLKKVEKEESLLPTISPWSRVPEGGANL